MGDVSTEFLDHLHAYYGVVVNLYRGISECTFCQQEGDFRVGEKLVEQAKRIQWPQQESSDLFDFFTILPSATSLICRNGWGQSLGNGEIRVFGKDGTAYACPTLLYHYIERHRYRPPDVFMQAVLEGPKPDDETYRKMLLATVEENAISASHHLCWNQSIVPVENCFDDNSLYHRCEPGTKGNPINIGWLGRTSRFETKEPRPEFLDALWWFCQTPVVTYESPVDCPLCVPCPYVFPFLIYQGYTMEIGTYECRVFSPEGKVYAVPNLIFHYVRDHHYNPPEEFIRAVMEGPKPDKPRYYEMMSTIGFEQPVRVML